MGEKRITHRVRLSAFAGYFFFPFHHYRHLCQPPLVDIDTTPLQCQPNPQRTRRLNTHTNCPRLHIEEAKRDSLELRDSAYRT
jgi:hypothetical protein